MEKEFKYSRGLIEEVKRQYRYDEERAKQKIEESLTVVWNFFHYYQKRSAAAKINRISKILIELKERTRLPFDNLEGDIWALIGSIFLRECEDKAETVRFKRMLGTSRLKVNKAIKKTETALKVLYNDKFLGEYTDWSEIKQLQHDLQKRLDLLSHTMAFYWAGAMALGAPSQPEDRYKTTYPQISFVVKLLTRVSNLTEKGACRYVARLGFEFGIFDRKKIERAIKKEDLLLSTAEFDKMVIERVTDTIRKSLKRPRFREQKPNQ